MWLVAQIDWLYIPVGGGLLEDDGVLGLVLDLSLGPLRVAVSFLLHFFMIFRRDCCRGCGVVVVAARFTS